MERCAASAAPDGERATLFQVGPLQIDVRPFNAHEVEHEAETDFAKKEVVGRRRIYESVGEGKEKLEIKGKLFPFKLGGLGALQLLHRLRQTASPQYVVRGDGSAMGWYVLTKVKSTSKHLASNGIGQEIDIETTLERADGPSASDYFFSIFGLAP